MMILFDVGYSHTQNGQDLSTYMPNPNDGLSFHEVKDFVRRVPNEYRQRFTVTVWTPNTDPKTDDTVRVLDTINADDFDRQFRDCSYNRARMIIESRHNVKYEGGWEEL